MLLVLGLVPLVGSIVVFALPARPRPAGQAGDAAVLAGDAGDHDRPLRRVHRRLAATGSSSSRRTSGSGRSGSASRSAWTGSRWCSSRWRRAGAGGASASWHDGDGGAVGTRQGLLRAAAAARGDDDRGLRGHRRLPVLRVLRGHADPDVLPDRVVRRPAPAVRGGEVLPLLAARRAGHARLGDRALLRHQRPQAFDFSQLVAGNIDPGLQKWLFLGFFIGFAIKAPLVPFHTWLPDAGAEAPAGGAALLVGVLDKVGTFGFLRYCLPLFPDASRSSRRWCSCSRSIGILYAALLAMGQKDMKRLVAYTSVAHFGFIAPRHLRVHHAGAVRRDLLHGQPRALHGRAVPRGRHARSPAAAAG